MAPPTLDPPWMTLRTRSAKSGKMSSTASVKNGAVGGAASTGPPLAIVCMGCKSTSSAAWHQKNGGQRLCDTCVYGSKVSNMPVLSPLTPVSTLEEGGPCSQCGAKRSDGWTTQADGAIFCSNCTIIVPRDSSPVIQCAECNATDTPMWRKAPNGNILCNACGSRYRRKHPRTGPRRGRGKAVRIRSKCSNCGIPSTRWPDTLCIDCGEQWVKTGLPKNAKTCTHCNMADTGRWLRGPDGPKSLCNACGKRWAKSGTLEYARKPADFVPRPRDDNQGEDTDDGANNLSVQQPAVDSAGSSSVRRPQCSDCGTTQTNKWRTGPSGRRSLCDECGIRWKRSGSAKPAYKPGKRSPSSPTPMATRSRSAVAAPVLAPPPAPVRMLDYQTEALQAPHVEKAAATPMVVSATTMLDDEISPPPEEHYASSLLSILGKRDRSDTYETYSYVDEVEDRASPSTEESGKKKGRKCGDADSEIAREATMETIDSLEKATALIKKKLQDKTQELDREELDTLNGLVAIGLGKLKDQLLI